MTRAIAGFAAAMILMSPSGDASGAAGGGTTTDAEQPSGPVVPTPVKFHFKAKKSLGQPKKPPLELTIPLVTDEGLTTGINDEKVRAFIRSLVNDAITDEVRDQINDDTNPVDSQDKLRTDRLTLEFLANMPAAERRGGGIAKETWEEFAKDYSEVMAAAAGKTPEQLQKMTRILTMRLAPVRLDKQVLAYVKEQLSLWFTSTQNQEDFAEVYEFLMQKADTFLAIDESTLLQNL